MSDRELSAGKGKIKRVSNVPIAAGLLACLFLLTPDVSAADVDRLLRAVDRNDVSAVRRLIAQDPESSTEANDEGLTPLHLAVSKGYIEIVRIFVFANADVNVQDDSGVTPIMRAAQNGHFEMVRILNEAIADLKSRDDKGWTVLHYAANNGKLEVIEYLMLRGAEVNDRTSEGTTPMSLARWKGLTDAAALIGQYGGVE
jgi:ankyrin repeat protein